MTRSARLAVGVVVAVVLLMVAAVSALVVVTTLLELRSPSPYADPYGSSSASVVFRDPVQVRGEVLDVDARQDEGWASMDVTFPDEDGVAEVGTVDLGVIDGRPLPRVGDTVDLVHERDDPTFVLRADDPALQPPGQGDADGDGVPDAEDPDDGLDDVDQVTPQEQRDAARSLVRRFGVLATASSVGALLVGVLTVVLVRRAPDEVAAAPQPGLVG